MSSYSQQNPELDDHSADGILNALLDAYGLDEL
jgi:hypothetical protein